MFKKIPQARQHQVIGLVVVLAMSIAVFSIVTGCGGAAAVPTSVPTAAAKVATQPIATTGAAVVATGAAVAPTVAAAATAAAPTVAAGATSLAPTVSAAGTVAAPTVAAAATTALAAITPAVPTVAAAQTAVAGAAATASSSTLGQLATSGQAVFTSQCAPCHGAQGQGGIGPAIIGPSASLDKYGTALGLLTKISTTMPRSNPGSLPPDQYLQVTAYLLVQNNYVQPGATLSSIQFGTVPLKK